MKWHRCAKLSYVHSAVALHEYELSMRLQFSTVPAHAVSIANTSLSSPHTSLEALIACLGPLAIAACLACYLAIQLVARPWHAPGSSQHIGKEDTIDNSRVVLIVVEAVIIPEIEAVRRRVVSRARLGCWCHTCAALGTRPA